MADQADADAAIGPLDADYPGHGPDGRCRVTARGEGGL